MRRILKKQTKLLAIPVVIILITLISLLSISAYSQEIEKSPSRGGIIWSNGLSVTVSKHVMAFDPNLCGVSFDTSLLMSKDLSSIYKAVTKKDIWKNGEKPIGHMFDRGNHVRLSKEIKKEEVLPLQFFDKSLVRIICDFKVSRLDFRYGRILPGNSQLADSTICLFVVADENVLGNLESVLSKQRYVTFVGRPGIGQEGGFKSAAPPQNEKKQTEFDQKPDRDDPDDDHFIYPHGVQDIRQNIMLAPRDWQDPWERGADEIAVFTNDDVLAGKTSDISAITLWGDNPNTEEVEGFYDGEDVHFMLWDNSASVEVELDNEEYIPNHPHGGFPITFSEGEGKVVWIETSLLGGGWPDDPRLSDQWHMNSTVGNPPTVKPNHLAAMTATGRSDLGQMASGGRIHVGVVEIFGIYNYPNGDFHYDLNNAQIEQSGHWDSINYPVQAPGDWRVALGSGN